MFGPGQGFQGPHADAHGPRVAAGDHAGREAEAQAQRKVDGLRSLPTLDDQAAVGAEARIAVEAVNLERGDERRQGHDIEDEAAGAVAVDIQSQRIGQVDEPALEIER